MKRLTIVVIMILCSFAFGSVAFSDVKIDAQLCNKSQGPVEFWFFNHNDITSGAVALDTKSVRACSCVHKDSHTDLWHNFPLIRINQLVYRDVGKVTGTSITACVDVKGTFEGYIEAGANACATAEETTSYLPAPELTRAQGDLKTLEAKLHADSTKCLHRDWTGGCVEYNATYIYSDGIDCHSND